MHGQRRSGGGARRGARMAVAAALVSPIVLLAALQGAGAAQTHGPRALTALIPPPLAPGAHRATASGRDLAPTVPTRSRATAPAPGTSPWQPLTTPFPGNPASMLLLTDGSVIVQGLCSPIWYRLTPDRTGSYLDGTWTQIATMPNGYAPLYDASAVLPDGRVIVEGGEYGSNCKTQVQMNEGAIYNPVANTWTSVSPPTGWTSIGDAPSTVLADGTFMLGQIEGTSAALLDPSNLSWTSTGSGKADAYDEEGLSLLPDDDVLTVDTTVSDGSELYSPTAGTWSSAGTTPSSLSTGEETGPQVLLPSGDVVAFGANGTDAFFDPSASAGHQWSAAPSLPVVGGKQYVTADAPAAVLPDGDVLVAASPFNGSSWSKPTHYFDLHGSTVTQVADSPNAANEYSYDVWMLDLPTGQVLVNDSGSLELYTDPNAAESGLAPADVSLSSTTLGPGATATVSGTQLNGVTQASAYGDDYQDATNFPLVKLVSDATKVVTFARTSAMTSMSVTPNLASSAHFTLPAATPLGASELYVGANGHWSTPTPVTVLYPTTTAFESSTADLGLDRAVSGATTTHVAMLRGTSPSAATLHNGSLAVAFQSGTGDLEVYRAPGATTNTHLLMRKGTSPSLTVLKNGSLAVAFQTTTGQLEVWRSTGGVLNGHNTLAPGTSPTLTTLHSGALEVAFQLSSGDLATWVSAGGGVNTHLLMAQDTSPSVAVLANGTSAVAFEAHSGALELWRSKGATADAHLAMRKGTSPSAAVLQDGAVAVALETSTGALEVWRSAGTTTNAHVVVRAGASPSMLVLPNGSLGVAYVSTSGILETWASAGAGVDTLQDVQVSTSPSLA